MNSMEEYDVFVSDEFVSSTNPVMWDVYFNPEDSANIAPLRIYEHIEEICDTKLFVGRIGDRIGTVTVHEDNTLEVKIDEDVKEELRNLVPQDTLPK